MKVVYFVIAFLLLSLFIVPFHESKADAPDNPILYYNMETLNAAGEMEDLSGYGNHGTIGGTSDVAGQIGRARNFDGINGHLISITNWNGLNGETSMSVGCWLYWHTYLQYASPIAQWGTTGQRRFILGYIGMTDTVEPYSASFWLGNAGSSLSVSINDVIYLNTWVHLMGVYDGTNMHIYIDGTLRNSVNFANPLGTSDSDLQVGYHNAGFKLDGIIDEVRIYDYALTSTQVAALYADTTRYPTDELTTWTTTFHFDEGVKSESGGNFEVETNMDNPGITTNQIELGNIKGDRFNYDDADADTWKWDVHVASGVDAPQSNTTQIIEGELQLGVERTGMTLSRYIGVSTGTYSDSIDIRVKMTSIAQNTTGGGDRSNLCVSNEAHQGCEGAAISATQDAVFIFYLTTVVMYKVTDGGATWCATGPAVTNPMWLRIVRNPSTTWTGYYSSDGSSWTSIGSCTSHTISEPLYGVIYLEDNNNDGSETRFNYDDFHVAAGTIDNGGFRTIGNWTTTDFTIPYNADLESMTLEGDFDTSNYIDEFDLYCDGELQVHYGTDISSSPFNYEFTGITEGTCYLHFLFVGTGGSFDVTDSPTVLSYVAVTFEYEEELDMFLWISLILAVVLLLIGLLARSGIMLIFSGLAWICVGFLLFPDIETAWEQIATYILWGFGVFTIALGGVVSYDSGA